MNRTDALVRFYGALERLEHRLGGKRMLGQCRGSLGWPKRGVYFFFEDGELRSDTGIGLRVVRVGTHGLTLGSKSTLWQRLSAHRGSHSGGGNQRGSIFRRLVGDCLLRKGLFGNIPSWNCGSSAATAASECGLSKESVRETEKQLEEAVSLHVRAMPFLWLNVPDDPGRDSERAFIESGSIALLSNHGRPPLDAASETWLGRWSCRENVRGSHLWNQRFVEDEVSEDFLTALEKRIES